MRHITVALLIPSPIVAFGVTGLLRKIPDVEFTLLELSGDNVMHEIENRRPSLLIIDPIADRCDWSEDFKSDNPMSRVIGVTHSSLPYAVRKNFDDIFSIYDSVETIVDIIKKNVIVEEDENKGKDLSPREKEVVVGIVKGLSNKEIASEMNVSVNTVMTHRRNIASKLHIHTPAGLTIYAIVSDLVKLEDVKDGVANGKL